MLVLVLVLLLLLREEAKGKTFAVSTFATTSALGLLVVEARLASRSRPIGMHRDKLGLLGRLHSSIGLDPSHEVCSSRLGYLQRCSLLEEVTTGLNDDLAIILE